MTTSKRSSKSSRRVPRPEHPRPQLTRDIDWINLNGEWEFCFDDENRGLAEGWHDGRRLDRKIIVPFPYQSPASGINDQTIHQVVWYSRDFNVKKEWREGWDVLLNFGAVDYKCTIWVNGIEVGHNQGGQVPFSLDLSPYVRTGGNRLTVRVEDWQDWQQPRGKQSVSGIPIGIDYVCTTGIWQTVWLEIVPQMRIEDVKITPNLQEGTFEISAYLHAPSSIGWTVKAEASFEGKRVAKAEVALRTSVPELKLKIPKPKLWSHVSPNLYDLKLDLYRGKLRYDTVFAYAGMRSVTLEKGWVHLNGKPVYLKMVLDQGYWPEGVLTAPSDAALRKDIEMSKALGFNGARKHQKVEDPRWLYWADKLGFLVWGEMANARDWSHKAEELLTAEWERVVRRDYNHPSIITWVPVNESWGFTGLHEGHPGQYAFLERIVSATRRLDHTRPVIDNDGWDHTDTTDIASIHDYAKTSEILRARYAETLTTGVPPFLTHANINLFTRGSKFRGQPIILTEVGGFLMIPPGLPAEERDELYLHYGSISDAKELLKSYEDVMGGISELPFVSGFCYTQLTDIGVELNGLLTYERKFKIPAATIKAINDRLFGKKDQFREENGRGK